LRADVTLESFRTRIQRFALAFDGPPPAVPPLPGILQIRRAARELVITRLDGSATGDDLAQQLGAVRCRPVPMDLEEAFIAFIAPRGEKTLQFPVDANGAQS
jgi:hypothetical protein